MMPSSIYQLLIKKFWRTSIYSSDLLLSIAMILLGMTMYQFVPFNNEPCLFNIARIIDGNQKHISLFLITIGFLQFWHVHSGAERRRLPHIIHTIALFISLGIWLTLTVASLFNSSPIPLASAAYASLALTSAWVFIRYGCPHVK